jgi:hypothetical protein
MNLPNRFFMVRFGIVVAIALSAFPSFAQSPVPIATGGPCNGVLSFSLSDGGYSQVAWGPGGIRIRSTFDLDYVWEPPFGKEIACVFFKAITERVIIILNDGTQLLSTVGGTGNGRQWETPTSLYKPLPPDQYEKCLGDALYVVAQSGGLYVLRDSLSPWVTDTVGFNGAIVNDAQIDSSQNVYAATSKGIFTQAPTGTTWTWMSNFPKNGTIPVRTIFIDRRDRIFAAASFGPYRSLDRGATWTTDSAGLRNINVTQFCDDALGNVYALTDNYSAGFTKIYISKGGTAPWTRIDIPLTSLSSNPSLTQIVNSISGDSALYAATAFGLFVTTDLGVSWSALNNGVQSKNVYGLIKTHDGKLVASTDLGIFERSNDTTWIKQFPADGYLAGGPLYIDNSGALYTLGAPRDLTGPSYMSPKVPWKSVDGGHTWNPDSVSLGSLPAGQQYKFYVDETGGEHVTSYGDPAHQNQVFARTTGGTWAADQSGFPALDSNQGQVFASDRNGMLYLATVGTSGSLWRRPLSGTTWTRDSAGFGAHVGAIYSIAAGKNGEMYAGTYGNSPNVFHRVSSGVWQPIPSPVGANAAFALGVDSTGRLLVNFSTYIYPTNLGAGIWSTTDDGGHWLHSGPDTIAMQQLVCYGDTTYAISYGSGMFSIIPSAAGVSRSTPTGIATLIGDNYPNPMSGETNLTYTLPSSGMMTLSIRDLLGRTRTVLLSEDEQAGDHSVTFHSSLPSGIYFFDLQTSEGITRKQFEILK